MAQCIPPRSVVQGFKVPLEPGEEALLDALLEGLDDSYEVFVQPFLNGDRPDLVILRKGSGALIIEVKDWTLSAYHTGAGNWKLRKNGTLITSPVQQVEAYKKHLFDLHVEALAVRRIFEPRTFGLVRGGVYLHGASTDEEAQHACGNPRWTVVAGRESLSAEGVQRLVGAAGLGRSRDLFDDELYCAFRRYLDPGEHHPDQGKTIVYTASQQPIVASATFRRRPRPSRFRTSPPDRLSPGKTTSGRGPPSTRPSPPRRIAVPVPPSSPRTSPPHSVDRLPRPSAGPLARRASPNGLRPTFS